MTLLLRTLHTVLLFWLADWYNFSELWMPCPWDACCIIARLLLIFWSQTWDFLSLVWSVLLDKLFSLYRCPKYTDIFVIKINTAWFHYFVINIVSRLPFSCVGECWAFVFLLIKCCYKTNLSSTMALVWSTNLDILQGLVGWKVSSS